MNIAAFDYPTFDQGLLAHWDGQGQSWQAVVNSRFRPAVLRYDICPIIGLSSFSALIRISIQYEGYGQSSSH